MMKKIATKMKTTKARTATTATGTDGALRGRCLKLYQQLSRDAILRQGDPVQTVFEFVLSEIGRKADPSLLESSIPLVLYFARDRDREDFAMLVRGAVLGMVMKKVL